jgi:hypothetical protein
VNEKVCKAVKLLVQSPKKKDYKILQRREGREINLEKTNAALFFNKHYPGTYYT